MMLLIGHPVWQNGIPQSMQRAPCIEASSSVSVEMNSRELRTRSVIGSVVSATRLSSMKPVIFPITLAPPSRDRKHDGAASRPSFSRRCLLLGLRSRRLGRSLRCVHLGERTAVFVREHLDELAPMSFPVVEHSERVRASGEAQMPLDQLAQRAFVRAARVAHAPLARRNELGLGTR